MEKTNLTEIALAEVTALLEPITEINTAQSATLLLHNVGYKLPESDIVEAFSDVISNIEDLIVLTNILIDVETEEEKMDAVIPLITAIANTIDGISDVVTEINNIPELTADFISKAQLSELPKRLLDYLIYQSLYKRRPKLFGTLLLMGILDEKELAEDNAIYQSECSLKIVQWHRIPRYLYEPGKVIDEVYDWTTDFNSDLFFERFALFSRAMGIAGGLYKQSESVKEFLENPTSELAEFRMPIFSDGVYPKTYAQFGINLTAAEARSGKKKGIGIIPYLNGKTEFDFELSEDWKAVFGANIDIDSMLGIVLRPPLSVEFISDNLSESIDLDLELKLEQNKNEEGEIQEVYLFGSESTSNMRVSGISLPIFAGLKDGEKDLGAEMNIENIILSIKGGDADGFISTLIPEEGITNTFGLGLGYSVKRGFYLTDSTSLEFSFATNITLGPVELQEFGFYIDPSADGVEIGAATQILANIGPLVAIVEEMGLRFNFPFPAEGEKGIPTPTIGFKPPAGIGLSIDTPVVSGGGYLYFDYDKGEYAGVGEISVKEIFSVSAIAIITTKPPAGATEPGFSLLIIIAATLPPIQLGFGFTLNGVGGLFAANRTMDLDALRAGVSNGTIDNLLFPDDPVKNAPQIIDQMGTVFPIEAGAFTFGVMAKLGWGTPTLISLEVGLIVKVPEPIKIAIVGVLKAILPEEKTPILALVVSFVGTIDPENELITFDASLEGSQLLGLKLYGEMAFRLRWGNDPMFLLSIGGFHPEFTPPAINLPSTFRRITLEILPDNPKLTLTGYFAITPNTLQFGAGVDMYIKKGKFNITGFCKFNTLIQFNPFYLSISLDAGLSVKWGNMELLGVSFGGSLSGPGPWVAKGYAEFKVVIKIKVNVSVKFGDRLETNQPTIKVLDLILNELAIDENYEVLFPSESKILAASRYEEARDGGAPSEEQKLLLHPAGKLSFKQLKVPLNVDLEKIGTRFVKGHDNFSLSMTNKENVEFETEDIQENFAPGEFFDLSLKQKLSRPSFEKYDGGLTMSDEAFSFSDDLELELIYESDSVDVKEDEEALNFKNGPLFRNEVGINKHTFDLFKTANTVHNQNVAHTPSTVVKENSINVVSPELALAYDGNSLEAVFTNFNDLNQFKNNLLITGEFDQQEIIPQYELFD